MTGGQHTPQTSRDDGTQSARGDTMTTTTDPTIGEAQIIPCSPFCVDLNPTDEACFGPARRVVLTLHDRAEFGTAGWGDEYACTYAISQRSTRAQYLHLGMGESAGMRLTPAEARHLAAALLASADDLDGSNR